jgi:rubrerythrin
MELSTFGAALKFAMDLETRGIETFEKAHEIAQDPKAKEMFLAFSDANRRRKATLESLYNESVYSDMDTGIFEPIRRMKTTDYLSPSKINKSPDLFAVLSGARDIEEKSNNFYLDLANEVKSRLRRVASNFEKMAGENAERALKIKAIQDQNH